MAQRAHRDALLFPFFVVRVCKSRMTVFLRPSIVRAIGGECRKGQAWSQPYNRRACIIACIILYVRGPVVLGVCVSGPSDCRIWRVHVRGCRVCAAGQARDAWCRRARTAAATGTAAVGKLSSPDRRAAAAAEVVMPGYR